MCLRSIATRAGGGWRAVAGAALLLCLSAASVAITQAGPQPGTYVVLDKEFFEAMAKLSQQSGVTYGDRQEPLLEQIALASRYMVKTNLTIIQQNEKIIGLLEELNRKRMLQDR